MHDLRLGHPTDGVQLIETLHSQQPTNLDVQAYIASGILESYVLGLTTAEETAEVEQLARQHPEVQTEIASLQAALEEFALTYEQPPPADLRDRVLGALNELAPADEGNPDSDREGGREIPLASSPPLSMHRSPRFTWWVAASWGLLLLSLVGNLLLYGRLRSTEDRLTLAEAQNTTLAQRVDVQQARFEDAQREVAFLQDPSTRKIELKGTPESPNARARVYWNTDNHQVYLSALRLPAPPSGRQYQLWAIVAGKPVDMGVFDLATNSLRLKDVLNAQAFAISLETTGGSTTAAGPKGPVVLLGGV